MNYVKSKQPVAEHGEVFTPAWMVEAMLDLVKGDRPLAELAKYVDIHPNQIQDWKKQLVAKAENVFGAGRGETATHE